MSLRKTFLIGDVVLSLGIGALVWNLTHQLTFALGNTLLVAAIQMCLSVWITKEEK